jgi:hypothetical protein
MAFTYTRKVDTESFIKARIRIRSQTSGSGSDHKGLDPTGSRSATLGLKPESHHIAAPAETPPNEFLQYLWNLFTLKKLSLGHLLTPGSGSGPRRPDPTKKVWIRPDPDPQHFR